MDHETVKQRLLEERAHWEREVEAYEEEFSESLEEASDESPYDQHLAETAGVTLDREIDLTLEESARATIVQIDRALQKLEDGTYGRCDKCGRGIGDGRLGVAPYATLCIDCKRLEERGL
ncbi:MAG: TraR/DksA family transcriptional regulator [Thermoleophilia bacterium]|nr:TraR/DksA family transcriptional regulator [Thermoleophilia bacterium]